MEAIVIGMMIGFLISGIAIGVIIGIFIEKYINMENKILKLQKKTKMQRSVNKDGKV